MFVLSIIGSVCSYVCMYVCMLGNTAAGLSFCVTLSFDKIDNINKSSCDYGFHISLLHMLNDVSCNQEYSISYNMGTYSLPELYTLSPQALGI